MASRFSAMMFVLLFIALRAGCEFGMMSAYGPDPQMAVWYVFMAARLSFWIATGVAAFSLLRAAQRSNRRAPVAFVFVVLWLAAICWSSLRYFDARSALVDAAAASTPPERLHELASFVGIKAGYELDNRIASNPNTTPETLRVLYNRREQAGTDMRLARNPNTPDDVLHGLANREGTVSPEIMDSLENNPRYEEVFGERD